MKPLPAQNDTHPKKPGEPPTVQPGQLTSYTGNYSAANRRSTAAKVQRAYPWLLAASTGLAAVFCVMYLTKPVVVPHAGEASLGEESQTAGQEQKVPSSLVPDPKQFPGKNQDMAPSSSAKSGLPAGAPTLSDYEETNLRVQHILTAEAPGGHINRIDINVPVLYQSRNLRWTSDEVAVAGELLLKLMDHQDRIRELRNQGEELLGAWNQLIGKSIPTSQLRADSPSLPENQEDSMNTPQAASKASADAIQLQDPE